MSRFRLILFLPFFLVFSYCNTGSTEKDTSGEGPTGDTSLSGTISIGGAFALYPMMQSWVDSFTSINPEVKIIISKVGTGDGISGLVADKYDIAMVSYPVDDSATSLSVKYFQVAQDAVVPVMNTKNPFVAELEKKGLTPQQLQNIYISGKKATWGELLGNDSNEEVVAYTRSDLSGAAEVWAGFMWSHQKDLKGIPVNGEDEMIGNIQSNPKAIGYCNLISAYDLKTKMPLPNLAILPIDFDFDRKVDFKDVRQLGLDEFHRNVWLGKYPKHLCRKLTVAIKKQDIDPLKYAFLMYILNEGQANVNSTGYCPLNHIQIERSVSVLNEDR